MVKKVFFLQMLIFISFTLIACNKEIREIEIYSRIKIPEKSVVIDRIENRGGLANEGETYIAVQLASNQHDMFIKELQENKWKRYEDKTSIKDLLNNELLAFWEVGYDYLQIEVSKGYFIFINQNSQDPRTEYASSVNYRFLVYDEKKKTLYYFREDT